MRHLGLLVLTLMLGSGAAEAQAIWTVAGNGTGGFSGDGGVATSAAIDRPYGLDVDAAGNLYIVDTFNNRIRKVDVAGNITTVAGNGTWATPPVTGSEIGDGGLAINASLFLPQSVVVDAEGNIFIADTMQVRVRRVDAITGIITTYAGGGPADFTGGATGDGGPATNAYINAPRGLALDSSGNLYIASDLHHRVRRVDAVTGIITTVAGNGSPTSNFAVDGGDGGLATNATLLYPNDVAVDAAGNIFIADKQNDRIRKVAAGTGIITTYVGPDWVLQDPDGIAVDSSGRLFITDTSQHRVVRADPPDATTGAVIAGIFGTGGFAGDGGPATAARLNTPFDVAIDQVGNIFIADHWNHRIRRVDGSVDAGPDQTVDERTLVQLDGCAAATAAGYSWTQVAGEPQVTLSNADTCSPTFTAPPVPPTGAVLTFQLTVTFGPSSLSDVVNVTVKDVNHEPVADAGDDLNIGEGVTVMLDGSHSYDPDGDALTYAWTQIAGAQVTLSDPQIATPTFVAPAVISGHESLKFKLTVSDGQSSSTDAVEIVVAHVNLPPTADAGSDASWTAGEIVTLDGSGSSDPEGAALSYLWTQIGGPAVKLQNDNQALASFTGAEPGTYVLRLTVIDPFGAFDSDEVTIVVTTPNDPPACELARPTLPYLWPPNHKMHVVEIAGVTAADGGAATISVVTVRQDEPLNDVGDGNTAPDAVVHNHTVLLRAERSGSGNGRVYHVGFHAESPGGRCEGTVKVFVPHDMRKPIGAVDEGALFDSTRR